MKTASRREFLGAPCSRGIIALTWGYSLQDIEDIETKMAAESKSATLKATVQKAKSAWRLNEEWAAVNP